MASRIQIGFAFACVNSLILAQAPPSAGNTQSQGVTASVAPAPPLSDPTRPASVTVSAFLDWISRSVPSQGEAARVMIRQAQFDARVAVALGEEALAVLRPGAYFGEMSLIDDAPRSATAMCNEKCRLFVVNRRDLEDLLFVDRDLAYELLWNWVRTLSRRLRATNDKMTFLATTSKF